MPGWQLARDLGAIPVPQVPVLQRRLRQAVRHHRPSGRDAEHAAEEHSVAAAHVAVRSGYGPDPVRAGTTVAPSNACARPDHDRPTDGPLPT